MRRMDKSALIEIFLTMKTRMSDKEEDDKEEQNEQKRIV
jgi:hypothetical protein